MRIAGTLEYYPDMRFTPTGIPICTFRLVQYPKLAIRVWRDQAEELCDVELNSGDVVILVGYTKDYHWSDHRGKHVTQEFNVKSVKWVKKDGTTGEL